MDGDILSGVLVLALLIAMFAAAIHLAPLHWARRERRQDERDRRAVLDDLRRNDERERP